MQKSLPHLLVFGVILLCVSSSFPLEEESWTPPRCTPAQEKLSRIGWKMKVLPPTNAALLNIQDDDYEVIKIGYGSGQNREWLTIGKGALWSLGIPNKKLLESSISIEKRERKPYGADYRGIQENGKRWRFVGFIGESITYTNASEEVARYFDSIIDGVCWDASAFPMDK